MKTTPNLGLKKPDQEDFYNVDDFNYNADKLDEEVARRIVNAGGVPSIQAGLDANKPTPGTAGRLYVATDTQMIYRDTGTAWQKVGVVKWDDIEGKPDLALASDLAAHLADTVADSNGAHGLKIESGTFTPVLVGQTVAGSHNYSSRFGYYYKIGRMVHCDLTIVITSKDTAMSGNVIISGLPFASRNQSTRQSAARISVVDKLDFTSGYTQLTALIPPNSNFLYLKEIGDNVSSKFIQANQIGDMFGISLSVDYETNS